MRLFLEFFNHYQAKYKCTWKHENESVSLHIIRDRAACTIYLSQAALIDCLLEQESEAVSFCEGLQHVDKPHGEKWDSLWPVNTLFAYKDPPLDIDECPSVPDPLLVHRFCVVNCFLQYIVNGFLQCTSPEFIYATNQLASLYKSSGPHHVKAMDYALWYLAGTTSLALHIGPKDDEEIVAVLLLLRDFGLSLTKIPLLVDNQPAMSIAAGTTPCSRSRHIDFKTHLCRDFVARDLLMTNWPIFLPSSLVLSFSFVTVLAWSV